MTAWNIARFASTPAWSFKTCLARSYGDQRGGRQRRDRAHGLHQHPRLLDAVCDRPVAFRKSQLLLNGGSAALTGDLSHGRGCRRPARRPRRATGKTGDEEARAAAVTAGRVIAAALLLAAAIGLAAQALAAEGRPTHAVVWGSLSFAAYSVSLLCLIGGGQGKFLGLGRWRFGSWILLWYCAAFGVATLTWVQPQTGTAAEISVSSVLWALWLVAVGMTLWALGYFTGPGRPARHCGARVMAALNLRFAPEVRSPLAPWILYAVGTAASAALAATTGRFGYLGNAQSAITTASGYQQILGDLSYCAPLAVAAAACGFTGSAYRVPG